MVEAVPGAGVVTVLEERRTVACNQFLERDRVEKERVRSEEEMARQRIEVEVEKERLRAEAAEVASADALVRQEARQCSRDYQEVKHVFEHVSAGQMGKQLQLDAKEQKLERAQAQQVRKAVETYEEEGELRQREWSLRQHTEREEEAMRGWTGKGLDI